jgi:hypothetical protein
MDRFRMARVRRRMNPYTQTLIAQIDEPELEQFTRLWDALEASAIEIYRSGRCLPDEAADYKSLLEELNSAYPTWERALEPNWKASRIKGESDNRDPFAPLLNMKACSDWVENQDMFRLLPAAREAINRYLSSLIE